MYFASRGKRVPPREHQALPWSSTPYFCEASFKVRPAQGPLRNRDPSSVIHTSPIRSSAPIDDSECPSREGGSPGILTGLAKSGSKLRWPQILGLKTGES